MRRAAAENAGAVGAGVLAVALGDRDPGVRLAAVRGLVSARAVEVLARAARSPDPEVRPAALVALGEVGGPLGKKTLENALDDGNENVRAAAVRGLARLGPEAAELLLRAVRDPARIVRAESVAGLGALWVTRPLTDLKQALGNEADADLRYAAALALSKKAGGTDGATARQLLEETGKRAPRARALPPA